MPASEEKFRSVVQMLNQAMMLKRRVVESLRPSLLDHFGLPVALRSHFDEHCARAGVEYIATLPDEMPDLEPAVQLTLFRVAQEALANLLARGQAKHVELVIEPEGEGYLMTVGDDGERDGRDAAARAVGHASPADGRRWLARSGCQCPGGATGSGLTSRDSEQNRDELIDLAHLVEEVIRAGLHAALAHRRQVVVRQHDDPDVAAVASRPCCARGPGG